MQSPNKSKLSVIPLGGTGEIGKNLLVFEYEESIVVIDGGVKFPGEELLGIDLVIPDISYLEENRDRIQGLFLTHGHEDHIGGLPYILPKLKIPIGRLDADGDEESSANQCSGWGYGYYCCNADTGQ